MNFTHIRHGSHILTYKGMKILVDPVFADKGSYAPIPFKRCSEKNPLSPLPFELKDIMAVDSVLITHLHNDHFDEVARKTLPKAIPILCHIVDAEKIKAMGFTKVTGIETSITLPEGIKITVTKGRHGYGLTGKALGHVSGFVLEDTASDTTKEPKLYIVGDSVWYQEVEKSLLDHQPDVITVFAGEARIGRSKPITMGTYDIDKIATTLPKAKIMVVHMEAWNHCSLSRQTLKKFIEDKPYREHIQVPDNGTSLPL